MKVHHTGYYVADIVAAVKTFEKLGYKIASECVHDETRKVSIQFLTHSSNVNGGGMIFLSWLSRTRIVRCFQSQQRNWEHTLTTSVMSARI